MHECAVSIRAIRVRIRPFVDRLSGIFSISKAYILVSKCPDHCPDTRALFSVKLTGLALTSLSLIHI